jgi:hypothetical protein
LNVTINAPGSGYSTGVRNTTVKTGSGDGTYAVNVEAVSSGALSNVWAWTNGSNYNVGDLSNVVGGTGGVIAMASPVSTVADSMEATMNSWVTGQGNQVQFGGQLGRFEAANSTNWGLAYFQNNPHPNGTGCEFISGNGNNSAGAGWLPQIILGMAKRKTF